MLQRKCSLPLNMIWSPTKKILFRFFCVYIFLYTMSCQFILSFLFSLIWDIVVPWFGEILTGKSIFIFPNGSGDTTYNYVQLVLFLAISIIVTIVWTLLDKKRNHYQKLFDWLVVLVRYYLIFQMLLYGFSKIFYLQFIPPSIEVLDQPIGDLSPMGLVWTFVGYSKGFTMLTGWLEVIGGTLLLFKRTQTFGALFVFAVMANVACFNYFYDVPVKLHSTHILAFCIFLISLDAKRLLNVFILNRVAEPREIRPLFKSDKLRKVKNGFKWIIVIAFYTRSTVLGFMSYNEIYKLLSEDGIVGTYDVVNFDKNGNKKSEKEIKDWKEVKISSGKRASVKTVDDFKINYKLKINKNDTLISITNSNTSLIDTLYLVRRDEQYLSLKGIVESDTLEILMMKRVRENYKLTRRKFQWINERPFN